MKPEVSIIMATYNRAHLINESLIAIQNQTFKDWECLIIDDGSNDHTDNTIADFTEVDPRFIFLKRPERYRKGLPGSRNYGLDKAKGDYVVFFDDDDIPHPQVLDLALKELYRSDYDFCRYLRKTFYGSFKNEFKKIDHCNSKKVGPTEFDDIITNKLPFNSCQVVWRKASIGKKRFEENLMYAEEWEFYSRLLSEGLVGVSINKALYFGRKHPNSNTGEYQKKDSIRVDSQRKAALMVIQTLKAKGLFNESLKKFFIRMGFETGSYGLIKMSLEEANIGIIGKMKFKIGFQIYPLLKPIFYLKGKFKKS